MSSPSSSSLPPSFSFGLYSAGGTASRRLRFLDAAGDDLGGGGIDVDDDDDDAAPAAVGWVAFAFIADEGIADDAAVDFDLATIEDAYVLLPPLPPAAIAVVDVDVDDAFASLFIVTAAECCAGGSSTALLFTSSGALVLRD